MLQIALAILGLWALVVEPTFGVFERLEGHAAPARQRCPGEGNCGELDQPVPPHEIIAAQWVNEHARAAVTLPSVDSIERIPGRLDGLPIAHAPLPAHLSLPFPPSVAPLRL